MMTTRMLRPQTSSSRFYARTEPFFEALNDRYLTDLRRFIDRRKRALWVLGTSAAVIVLFFMVLREEVAPLEDRSSLNSTAVAPERSTFEYTERSLDQI